MGFQNVQNGLSHPLYSLLLSPSEISFGRSFIRALNVPLFIAVFFENKSFEGFFNDLPPRTEFCLRILDSLKCMRIGGIQLNSLLLSARFPLNMVRWISDGGRIGRLVS